MISPWIPVGGRFPLVSSHHILLPASTHRYSFKLGDGEPNKRIVSSSLPLLSREGLMQHIAALKPNVDNVDLSIVFTVLRYLWTVKLSHTREYGVCTRGCTRLRRSSREVVKKSFVVVAFCKLGVGVSPSEPVISWCPNAVGFSSTTWSSAHPKLVSKWLVCRSCANPRFSCRVINSIMKSGRTWSCVIMDASISWPTFMNQWRRFSIPHQCTILRPPPKVINRSTWSKLEMWLQRLPSWCSSVSRDQTHE